MNVKQTIIKLRLNSKTSPHKYRPSRIKKRYHRFFLKTFNIRGFMKSHLLIYSVTTKLSIRSLFFTFTV